MLLERGEGTHSNLPDGKPLFWPLGPNHVSKDVLVEECVLNPRLSLVRFYDHPIWGGNTMQLSYPQVRTVVRGCQLWWEQGPYPPQFAAIQLAEGVDATVRGNVFHRVASPEDHTIHIGDSAPAKWPSKINPDWKTANEFRAASAD